MRYKSADGNTMNTGLHQRGNVFLQDAADGDYRDADISLLQRLHNGLVAAQAQDGAEVLLGGGKAVRPYAYIAGAVLHMLKDIFQGYGFDGGTMVSYQSAGWLKTAGADPGAIWWLLFSGRWGQNAQEGSDGMRSCWQSVWKDGQTGGRGNPGCNSKAPGRAPTETEVAYASYLLNGLPVVGGSGTALLPRWTLNDGGE